VELAAAEASVAQAGTNLRVAETNEASLILGSSSSQPRHR